MGYELLSFSYYMCLSMPLQFCHEQEDLLALTNGKHWADQQSEVFKKVHYCTFH